MRFEPTATHTQNQTRPDVFQSRPQSGVFVTFGLGARSSPVPLDDTLTFLANDKGKGPLKGIKILDDLEQRIEKVENILNKAKEKMVLKKGKEKMVMEREVIIIEDTDDNPFQVTSDESSDDRALQL
ncbi:hypothetical protein Tco_1390671 [Tanacetum coccineum]